MKKTVSLICALLMTGSMIISCGGGKEAQSNLPENTSAAAAETELTTTEETAPPSAVPEGLDFEGATFTLLGGDSVFEHYTQAREVTGDGMNDSLYERYQRVGSMLNIEFDFLMENSSGAVSKITSTVLAGDDTYQLAIVQRATSIAKMVGGSLLYNFNDLPYIDLDGEYWYQSAIDSLRVDDFIYYTYGDIYPLSAHVFYYNKDIAEAYQLESPHKLVLDGKWTIDKMTEMAIAVPKDLNGDGVMDDKDQYGISFSNTDTINSLMYGCGLTITEKNSSGVKLCPCTDRTLDVFDKVFKLTNTNNSAYLKKLNTLKLTTGQVLFYTGSVHGARTYRDSEVEFGLLPYPKFDENQEKHISFLNTELMCVPSIADKELAGATIQLLAENSEDVKTAYYEYLLKEKVARDPESAQVLDIIFDNAINDFIISFCGGMSKSGSMYTIPSTLVTKGQTEFTSAYEKIAEAVQNEINEVYDMIKASKQ